MLDWYILRDVGSILCCLVCRTYKGPIATAQCVPSCIMTFNCVCFVYVSGQCHILFVCLTQNDLPPWITRLRIWDSSGSYVRTTSPSSISSTRSGSSSSGSNGSSTTSSSNNYYYSPQNPLHGKHIKVNIDNIWNPVDTYIYGPTQNSIFNQAEQKYGGLSPQKYEKFGNALSSSSGGKENGKIEKNGYSTTSGDMTAGRSSTTKSQRYSNSRRLIAELYDNETPRLCDHSLLEENGNRMRPCSPLESYVSTARDLVIQAFKSDFHCYVNTAPYTG